MWKTQHQAGPRTGHLVRHELKDWWKEVIAQSKERPKHFERQK